MAFVGLTQRAIRDIREIEAYSIVKWGDKIAAQYLQNIEDALNMLRENPQLLKDIPHASDSLSFYRVRQHFLVCASYESSLFVLTVKHGAMNLPTRLAELEPQLLKEAEILHQAYLKKHLQK